jgi:hypothetical protein
MVRLAASATARDFLNAVDPPGHRANSVWLEEVALSLDRPIAGVVGGPPVEIARRVQMCLLAEETLKVKYQVEESTDVFCRTIIASATIADFLNLFSRRVPAASVTADGAIVESDELVANWIDSKLVVSPRPSPGDFRVEESVAELDLVIVLDATHSIRPSIQAVRNYAHKFAFAFRAYCDLRLRVACVCYRDPVDDPGSRHFVLPFTPSVRSLTKFLNGKGDWDGLPVVGEGGGDQPED